MNILVSGIASDIGYNVGKIIKELNISNKLYGMDILNKIYSTNIFDNQLISSKANNKFYLKRLTEIIQKYKVDIFIPTSEAEISVLSKLKYNKFLENKILINDNATVETFLDKYKTLDFLSKNKIDVPKNGLVGKLNPQNYPIIIKPRYGRGSKNIKIIKDYKDLKNYNESYVWQELLEPANEEYTCPVFISKKKDIRIIIMKRKIVNGITNSGQVMNDKYIYKYVEDIAKLIKSSGPINIQLIMTNNGPLVFEINPRLSSTLMFRHKMGFTDLKWWIDELKNKKIENYIIPKNGIKFYLKNKKYIIEKFND